MTTERLLLAVNIAIALGLAVYGAVGTSDLNRLAFTLPLISILVVFLVFVFVAAGSERRLLHELDRRLPQVEHLADREDVERELAALAGRAREFILATGGRSRDLTYLETIEKKVATEGVIYWRLLYDEPISHQMCQHIRRLIAQPNVGVAIVSGHHNENMLIVESGFIIALPLPGTGGLMGMKVGSPASARKMKAYSMLLHKGARTVSDATAIVALCDECNRSAGAPPPAVIDRPPNPPLQPTAPST